MLKTFGALLLLVAGLLLGLYQSQTLSRRPKQIRQLVLALQRLETEIGYGSTPLPDALRACAVSLSPPLAAIFLDAAERMAESGSGRTAAESWEKAVLVGFRRTAMKEPEREALLQLGATLGISDTRDQLKHLRLAVSHLSVEESNASDEEKRYGKMWKSLGVLGAALVVVIMF
ncbi:stage III sporulation protein SpoIIIAB [Gorillibacterium timonense]|uniref:stage III sporulation protein SpoIIIAB n=1 Tax=Gorillibacterium timonense TaxID=1689269 RepID=UPI00071DD202|nr:stage III sporulation protein SpoIIIAB [Gorillibacterium timonense]